MKTTFPSRLLLLLSAFQLFSFSAFDLHAQPSPVATTPFTRGLLRSTNNAQALTTLGLSTNNGTIQTNVTVTVTNQTDVTNFTGSIALTTGINAEQSATNAAFDLAQADFYVVNIGDIHAGITSTNFTSDTNTVLVLSNSVNTILAWKTSGSNIIAFTSPGDLYDSGTDSNNVVALTNQLWRLKNAGIKPVVCPGNHESGGAAHWWEEMLGTNLLDYTWSKDVTNTRYSFWAYTNRSTKLGFVMANGAYSDDTISYCATNWPEHQIVVLTHFYYDAFGAFSSSYDSRRSTVRKYPNIFAVLSGHWRCGLAWGHNQDSGDAGNCITSLFQNGQQMTNAGNNIVRVYRFKPTANTVFASTWDNTSGLWLTNGQQNAISTRGQSNGYWSNFTFPMSGAASVPALQRGAGIQIANPDFDESDGAVIYSGQTNELLDTFYALQRTTNGAPLDTWYLARTHTNANLELRHAGLNESAERSVVKGEFDASGDYSSAAALHGVGYEFLPTSQTNRVSVSGATSTTINGNYVRVTAVYFTNTTSGATAWLTNGGAGYWTLGRTVKPDSYTNAALFGQYTISGATSTTPPIVVPINEVAGGTFYPSNAWNLGSITGALANFGCWIGPSNGSAVVSVYLSNGTAYVTQLAP